ncbi:MAG: glycosyltransferase family 39 protein [Chloroflexi bacterium]|nr:glycosyltransferase family 39 protein [Chloroflexota bacterium]
MKRLLAFVLAFILAAVAQRTLSKGGVANDAAIFFAVAALVFVASAEKPAPWPQLPSRRRWPRGTLALAAVALLLGIVAFVLFWRGRGSPTQFTGPALWLWLISIPLFLAAVWFGELRIADCGLRIAKFEIRYSKRELGLLLLILLAAFFLRTWQLDAIPNGCQSDECNNGLDALQWLAGAPYTPYAETNEGQATFFTYLLALSFKLFGATVPTMRLVSAIGGTLTVLAFYFLARDLFGSQVGLAAAGLLAASRWHLTFSRIIYELILVPLFEVLLFYFLLRALRHGRRRDWALAGVALSAGLNTYTAFRVIPFLVAVFLLYWLVHAAVTGVGTRRQGDKETRKLVSLSPLHLVPLSQWEGLACFAGAAALTVLPLGVYVLQHWNVFLSRTRHISVFRDVERVGSYEPLWSNLRKTLFMFNWTGDAAALNNLPGAPLLDVVVGVLFVLGLAYALRHLLRPLPFLYVTWFIAVASVAVLSVAHEAPTARRPIGLVPLVYLLAAVVLDQTWRAVRRAGWRDAPSERVFAGALALLVVGVGIGNARTYFLKQAQDPSVLFAYSPSESAVGHYLAELEGDPYILMTPGYPHHSAVRFIGRRQATPLNLGQQVPLREDLSRDLIYVLEPVDARLGPLFQQVYPGGTWQVHRDSVGRALFISFEVPQETLTAARGLAGRYFQGQETTAAPARAQRDEIFDFDWATAPPLTPPFAASWEGALLVPRYGEYRFELTAAGGRARVLLDGQLLLEADDGRAEVQRTLAGGFYGFEAEFISKDTPQSLRLAWSGPDFDLRAVGAGALYTLPGATNGLVGYYHSNPSWSGTPALIQRDLFILPNNPLRAPFSILWKGKIAAPRAGTYRFGTRSDDGSLVTVDGQLVVDNGGEHGSEYREGSIQLTEGFHDIEVRYFQMGGSRDMQLWWSPPGGGQEIIPSQYLFPLEEIPEGLELPELVIPPPVPTPERIPVEPEIAPEPAPAAPPPAVGPAGEFPVLELDLLWQVGRCGSGKAEFQMPRGVAVDAAGNVYVADADNRRVVKLSAEGEPLLSWGKEGEGDGQFVEPFDLVVDAQGNVVVLDAVAHRLQRFTPEGQFLVAFGRDLAFYRPRGLGIDAQDNLYVADTGGVRLLKVSPEGARLAQVGGPEEQIGPGQPTDVGVSPSGDIYLVEAMSGILWRLDAGGAVLERWPVGQANTLDSPHIAIGPVGNVYVTDPEGGRVLVFSADGQPLGQFGSLGDGPGQFRKPVGIAVGSDGRVIVSDSHGCRVVAFGALE